MKKVIITGATGFIGGALTKKMLNEGLTVYGVDIDAKRLDEMKKYKNFIPIVADFAQYHRIDKIISSTDFDALYHFAWSGALTGADLNDISLQNKNIEASCCLASAISSLNVKKMIFISSSNQFLFHKNTSINSTLYGIAKKAAENMCRSICYKNNIGYTAAILTNTYGIGDKSSKAVNTFIHRMLNDKPIDLVEGTNKNDWMYIDETINGLAYLLDCDIINSSIYIGHKDITSFKDKLILMKTILNSESELRFGKYNDMSEYDYSDIQNITIDNSILHSPSFKESILKTTEWVKTLDWED